MKRLKSGVVNTLSFIKTKDYVVNDFSITLEKVVGSETLELTGLLDSKNLDDCSDFVVINVDLVTNELGGGEYLLYLTNGGTTHKYLCNIEKGGYTSTSSSGVYGNTVILSDTITSSTGTGGTDGQSPTSGSSLFSVQLRDNNYGDMTSPYYVRNEYFVQANIENISTSISKIRSVITDSLGNQIQKDFTVTDYSLLLSQFTFENEPINFGDVATLEYQGLDSNNNILYTSSQYLLIIPPKMELYVADSLSSAENMRLNGSLSIDVLNGSTTTYNIYAYVESNYSADIILDNISIVRDKVFLNGTASRLLGTSPLTINPTEGSMQLVASDVAPAWNIDLSERAINYFARFTWSGGYSTPLINNIEDVYNFFVYGVEANQINQRPYPKETLTIDGTTFTLEGFSPILYNSLTQYAAAPNDTLSLYMGDGSFKMNVNYINNIAVQQEYSDLTTEDFIITKSAILGGQAFGGMVGDSWDVVAYISKINSSKTLVHTKAWIQYGSYWFNIDNGSVEAPHFLIER